MTVIDLTDPINTTDTPYAQCRWALRNLAAEPDNACVGGLMRAYLIEKMGLLDEDDLGDIERRLDYQGVTL